MSANKYFKKPLSEGSCFCTLNHKCKAILTHKKCVVKLINAYFLSSTFCTVFRVELW